MSIVCRRPGLSSNVVLSARAELAVAGIRKELFIWSMESSQLVKVITPIPEWLFVLARTDIVAEVKGGPR